MSDELYIEQARAECIEMDEHFKRIISENGNDVCFNCGASS